jgi:hypothetical protein
VVVGSSPMLLDCDCGLEVVLSSSSSSGRPDKSVSELGFGKEKSVCEREGVGRAMRRMCGGRIFTCNNSG